MDEIRYQSGYGRAYLIMPSQGEALYRRLMDLAEILQDIEAMAPLYKLLVSIPDNNNAMRKLGAEVEAFIARIDALVKAANNI